MALESIENPSVRNVNGHGLASETLSNCSLNDMRACSSVRNSGIPEQFPTVALLTERSSPSASLQSPTGSEVSIGGENCHMDIRFRNGQMIITPTPNSVCDVRVTPAQPPGLGKADY